VIEHGFVNRMSHGSCVLLVRTARGGTPCTTPRARVRRRFADVLTRTTTRACLRWDRRLRHHLLRRAYGGGAHRKHGATGPAVDEYLHAYRVSGRGKAFKADGGMHRHWSSPLEVIDSSEELHEGFMDKLKAFTRGSQQGT